MSETKRQLTVNQLVAYNLALARRRKGWTQEETAARLTQVTGRQWTKATLGSAERTWETGRTREFNANELLAFCRVFDEPLPYFFLPVGADDPWATLPEYPVTDQYSLGSQDDGGAEVMDAYKLLSTALALRPVSSQFMDIVQGVMRKRGLIWSPSHVDWYFPEEWDGADESEDAAQPAGAESTDLEKTHKKEARDREVLRRLRELINLVSNEERPPF